MNNDKYPTNVTIPQGKEARTGRGKSQVARELFPPSPNFNAVQDRTLAAAASTTRNGSLNNSSNSPFPVYYVSPYDHTESSNVFFINYLIHQALSLTALVLGHCFFLAIGAQFLTSLFSSIIILLLTGILAGLCAFPVAALGSPRLTRYFQRPESQRSVFLILAAVCQIVFNVLLLAGLSSTYFFALCALYTTVPLLILATRSVLTYCQCPTLPQANSPYDLFTPITDITRNETSVNVLSMFDKQNPLSAGASTQPGSNNRSSDIYFVYFGLLGSGT